MRIRGFLSVATVLLLSTTLLAAQATPLANLNWLAGKWLVEKNGKLTEEEWTSPRGGLMLGHSREIETKIDKTVAFEFLRIEQRGDTLVYVAQPGGRPPTDFTLSSATDKEFVFSNPQHDFPKVIRYRLNDDGSLTASVEDATGKKRFAYEYKRAN